MDFLCRVIQERENIDMGKLDSKQITKRIFLKLKADYTAQNGWLVLPELKMGIGYQSRASQRSIDLFVFNVYPSKHYTRIAFEIKTRVEDFNLELRQPDKRRGAVRFSNEYYFVTPVGLLEPDRIPPECGLIEIHGLDKDTGYLYKKIKIEAPWHDNIPNWSIVASLASRIKDLESEKILI